MAAYAPVLGAKPMTMIMVDPKERLFNITSTNTYEEKDAKNNSKESSPTV